MYDDLISRQAAIDALKEAFNPSITNFVKAKIAIDNLPSAQPVIRCKECEQWYMDADAGSACKYTNMYQPADGFCNWAERRTDEGSD